MSSKKSGIASEHFWLRILFMLFFIVAYQIVELLVLIISLIQLVYVALNNDKNLFLQQTGASLSDYAQQIFRYLTWNSETKPYPFTPWPQGMAPDTDPYEPKAETETPQQTKEISDQ